MEGKTLSWEKMVCWTTVMVIKKRTQLCQKFSGAGGMYDLVVMEEEMYQGPTALFVLHK